MEGKGKGMKKEVMEEGRRKGSRRRRKGMKEGIRRGDDWPRQFVESDGDIAGTGKRPAG
jgi:hypothetical protein